MSLGSLLLHPKGLALFNHRIEVDSRNLSTELGISISKADLILRETAFLKEVDEPESVQIRRIIEDGLQHEDIDYEPSIFESINILGKQKTVQVFSDDISALKKAWRINKILEFPLPLLVSTEWQQILGKVLDYFKTNHQQLSLKGLAPEPLEVSSLLKFIPRGVVVRFDDLSPTASELRGDSTQKVLSKLTAIDLASDQKFNDLVPDFRKMILNFYQESFVLLSKSSIEMPSVGVAKMLATITNKVFKSWENLEDLKGIESSILRRLSGETDNESDFDEEEIEDFINEGFYTELNRPVSIPLIIQDILQLAFYLSNERENSIATNLRSRFQSEFNFTSFGFPILNIDFWRSLENDSSSFLKRSEELDSSLRLILNQYNNFISAFIDELRRLFVIDLPLYVDELVQKHFEETTDIIDWLRGVSVSSLQKYQLRDTEYYFENGFTTLIWRSHQWDFRPWEGKILEAFYLAYQNGTLDLSTDQIHAIATEVHYKEVSPKSKTKKRMFTHVFQGHELNQKFIVSGPTKGMYRLNPRWTPSGPATTETPIVRKKRLARRS